MSTVVQPHIPCPVCPSSDAYCLYDDGHGFCYSCNYLYKPNKDYTLEDFSYEYLPWRGVSADTFRLYDCKTKIDGAGKPLSIGFRYADGIFKVRRLDEKAFHTVGDIAPAGLFGKDKFPLGTHKYVTITEGELDACSYHQVLRSPVVSVQSSSSAVRDCSVDRTWLNSFERIYLAFDSDSVGRAAIERVAKLFDYNKVYVVKLARKDANEHLLLGEEEELRNLWWNAKKYLPESIISSFDDFAKILKQPLERGVSYPFPRLNEMTYGIRQSESVLITAQEGVGKTELMHTLEYHILKETDHGVGAIFLEEPKKRHLQALAGLELRSPVHLPDTSYSEGDILAAVRKVVSRDERLHIYSHFGSDDPEVILDTIRFLVAARSCRFVLLDHISMVVSALSGEDERKALDYLSTRLEMLVKELAFALIIVSHVNDFGQTRGSRYISKVADMRIDLQRDLLSSDPTTRNTTRLTVSKNRFSGRTGPAGSICYDPLTCQYTEVADVQFDEGDRTFSPDMGMEVRGQGTKEESEVQVRTASNDNAPSGRQGAAA